MPKVGVIEFITTVGDGGAETLVKDYALLLDKERFDVTVVVLHDLKNSANYRRLQENGIRVIALSSQEDPLKKIWRRIFKTPTEEELSAQDYTETPREPSDGRKSMFGRCKSFLRNLYFGARFMKIVNETGAAVVHAHLEVLEILQAISRPLRGIRLFHTCHNPPEVIYVDEERPAAEALIRKNGMRLIALHPEMAKELNELFGVKNTVTIRNGIDMPRFLDPGVTREEKRKELGIPEDAFVVGHVGRFFGQKNHPFLVEVFRETALRQKNAYLLMVGAGDTTFVEEKLREYGLQDRYQILSHREDINEILKAMDVFVFPSLFEGFGIALLEAQAAGLRCIASDRCPMEVFRTETALALPPEDPAQWAEAVLDPTLRRENTRELWDYDMKREIRRLEELYLGTLYE